MPPPPPVNPQRLSPAESRERTLGFLQGLGVEVPLPASAERPDAYADLVRAVLSSAAVSSSRVSHTLTISPALTNQYKTLHGGAVAAVAEAVGMACARAAVGDKEFFLGELSTAYLAAARLNTAAGDHRGAGPRSSKASDAGGDVGGGAGEEAVARGLADGGAGIHPRPWRRCAPPGRGRPARRLLRARPRHPLLHRRLHFPGTAGLLHHHRLARRDQRVQHAPRWRGGGLGRDRRDGVRAGRRRGQGVVPR